MSKKKKRIEKFLQTKLPSYETFETVNQVYMDVGYKLDNTTGSHFVYIKGTSIKSVPTISGKKVARPYLEELQENIKKWIGVKNV